MGMRVVPAHCCIMGSVPPACALLTPCHGTSLRAQLLRQGGPPEPRTSKQQCCHVLPHPAVPRCPRRFAELYQEDGLTGGHVIMLGADEASKVIDRDASVLGAVCSAHVCSNV